MCKCDLSLDMTVGEIGSFVKIDLVTSPDLFFRGYRRLLCIKRKTWKRGSDGRGDCYRSYHLLTSKVDFIFIILCSLLYLACNISREVSLFFLIDHPWYMVEHLIRVNPSEVFHMGLTPLLESWRGAFELGSKTYQECTPLGFFNVHCEGPFL